MTRTAGLAPVLAALVLAAFARPGHGEGHGIVVDSTPKHQETLAVAPSGSSFASTAGSRRAGARSRSWAPSRVVSSRAPGRRCGAGYPCASRRLPSSPAPIAPSGRCWPPTGTSPRGQSSSPWRPGLPPNGTWGARAAMGRHLVASLAALVVLLACPGGRRPRRLTRSWPVPCRRVARRSRRSPTGSISGSASGSSPPSRA